MRAKINNKMRLRKARASLTIKDIKLSGALFLLDRHDSPGLTYSVNDNSLVGDWYGTSARQQFGDRGRAA